MTGEIKVTKKFNLELTEQEMNSISIAVGALSVQRLQDTAKTEGVSVLATSAEYNALWNNLRFLATGKN